MKLTHGCTYENYFTAKKRALKEDEVGQSTNVLRMWRSLMLILQINLDILYFGLETIMILNEWKLI